MVIIAKRIHLFPYRTQKLSSLALMVLGGRLPGRVRHSHVNAEVAELADAQDLKSCGTYTPVPVRFRSPALKIKYYVRVAQLDRASDYGSEGREFESSCARYKKALEIQGLFAVLRKSSGISLVDRFFTASSLPAATAVS